MNSDLPQRLSDRIEHLIGALPPRSEIARLMKILDDPAYDEASKDRYVAIVAASSVEGALRLSLAAYHRSGKPKAHQTFAKRIKRAAALEIVTKEEEVELHRIREIRNIFAHALMPVSFSTPEVVEVTSLFRDYPVTDLATYFLPVFSPRHRFAIICGAFFRKLQPADFGAGAE